MAPKTLQMHIVSAFANECKLFSFAHTYRDKHAVSILKLFSFVTNNLIKTLHVIHSNDADVVVETEGLDESEVDLESDVALKLLIHRQDAERHAVWVTEIQEEANYKHKLYY